MEGMLIGVMLFMAGLAIGGGGVWFITRRYEAERMMLNRVIGQLQQEVERQAGLGIPAEEM